MSIVAFERVDNPPTERLAAPTQKRNVVNHGKDAVGRMQVAARSPHRMGFEPHRGSIDRISHPIETQNRPPSVVIRCGRSDDVDALRLVQCGGHDSIPSCRKVPF